MTDAALKPDRIRRYVRSEHGAVLRAIRDAADGIAPERGAPIGSDREAVVEPFRAALEESGVLSTLPGVLSDVVDETSHELPASPAPAPPYVVVASTGVVLRVTLPPGRLVVAIEPFAVSGGSPRTYYRRDGLAVDVRVE